MQAGLRMLKYNCLNRQERLRQMRGNQQVLQYKNQHQQEHFLQRREHLQPMQVTKLPERILCRLWKPRRE
jgi:hypothetical protein